MDILTYEGKNHSATPPVYEMLNVTIVSKMFITLDQYLRCGKNIIILFNKLYGFTST